MYYLCSKNKGADQLRVYRSADLCLCCIFFYMPKAGFLMTWILFLHLLHLALNLYNVTIALFLLCVYEGGSIYNGNVPINRKVLYLYALQLHSQKDMLLDYTTAKS